MRFWRLSLWACVAAALGVSAVGCNIVGPLLYLVHGPAKIPMVYELDSERPTVIFLDDRAGVVGHAQLRNLITTRAEQDLLDAGAVETLIESRAASTLVANEPRGDLMPISQVGRQVGAEVVIYVVPETFTLSPDGQSLSPTASLRVKILDASADERIWPEDRHGHLLEVVASGRQGLPPTDSAGQRAAEEEFATLVGQRLAEMFYEHERETASDQRTR